MKNQTRVIALTVIALGLVGCSKKSADTPITRQEGSDVQRVTNNGFVTITKRTVKPTAAKADNPIAQQEASGGQVVTNDEGFVTVTKRTVKPTPNTNELSK